MILILISTGWFCALGELVQMAVVQLPQRVEEHPEQPPRLGEVTARAPHHHVLRDQFELFVQSQVSLQRRRLAAGGACYEKIEVVERDRLSIASESLEITRPANVRLGASVFIPSASTPKLKANRFIDIHNISTTESRNEYMVFRRRVSAPGIGSSGP